MLVQSMYQILVHNNYQLLPNNNYKYCLIITTKYWSIPTIKHCSTITIKCWSTTTTKHWSNKYQMRLQSNNSNVAQKVEVLNMEPSNQFLHTTRCRHTQLVHSHGIILLVLCLLLKRNSRTCQQLGTRASHRLMDRYQSVSSGIFNHNE